jgi:hypothetical protein
MQFNYNYACGREFIAADMQRFVDFLMEEGVESVSDLKITCHLSRNGKRLQAVNEHGIIRPVVFSIEPGDLRAGSAGYQYPREKLIIREGPVGHRLKGLSALLGPAD